MKVSPPGGQICKQCKWRHEVAKFVINKIIRVQDLTAWFRCAPSNVFRKDTIGKCMKNFFSDTWFQVLDTRGAIFKIPKNAQIGANWTVYMIWTK